MKSSVDQKIEDAFNYAVNFYNTHPRSLENQWACLAELKRITGLDDESCCKIQNPILSILMYQETIDIANEAIQHQLNIVTNLLRNRLLELQPTLQTGVVNELPYIPKVLSKPTVVNSLDEAVKEQIPSDGVYQLVNFSSKDLGYKGVEHLLYNEEGKKALNSGSSNLKEIYQGMLAKQGVMIVRLDLSNCNIGGLGADKLGQAIYNGSSLGSLEHLNLSNNNIDDSGIYSFGNTKGGTPSLRSINLSNNLLTDNGAQSLSWSFKKNNFYYVNHLDVSGNKGITEKGKGALIKSVDESLNTNLNITFVKEPIKKFGDENRSVSHEVIKNLLKMHLEFAASQGVHPNNIKINKTGYDYFKQGVVVGGKIALGVGKCVYWPLGLIDTTAPELTIDALIGLSESKTLSKLNTVVCFGMEGYDLATDQDVVDMSADCTIF